MRIVAAFTVLLLPLVAHAQPAGCPHDADGDGRVDIDDLYHLTQNPADINGDGVADAEDARCLEAYLRCVELLDMSFRPGEPAADGNVPSLEYIQTDTGGGLSQTLSVVRTPSPDGIACFSQSWTTTLLGTRPGLVGPVEIRLDRDGFLWQGLFADAASTSPGSTITSGMLTCDGSTIELVAVAPGGTVGSADGLRALVLLDGQSVTDQAVAKGVADAAGRDIGGGLIDAYTDINGVVTLPTRGMLVLFELDGTDQSDPAFAFDDAAVLVEVGCGNVEDATPQMFVLRDTIPTDPGVLDGNLIVINADGPEANNACLFEISGGQRGLRLIQVELVHDNNTVFWPLDWDRVAFDFKMWRSVAETLGSGNETGTVRDFPLTLAVNPPTVLNDPDEERRLLVFDLDARNVVVPAGEVFYFAIPQVNSDLVLSGFTGGVETAFLGESDWMIRPAGTDPVTVLGDFHGVLAIRITAQLLE
jgi:hypothetical protein